MCVIMEGMFSQKATWRLQHCHKTVMQQLSVRILLNISSLSTVATLSVCQEGWNNDDPPLSNTHAQ